MAIPTFLTEWNAKFAAYDPNFNTRTITHGNQNAFWAEILEDGSFGEPKPIAGNRSNTMTPEETQLAFYADNIVHYGGFATSTISGEALFHNELEPTFAEYALGQTPSTNGLVATGGNRQSFVFGFVELVDGNKLEEQDYKLNIYYNVQAGSSEVVSATDEAELTPKEYKIALTASANGNVFNSKGKPVAYAYMFRSTNPTLFDTFMTSVLVPEEIATTPATATFGTDATPTATTLGGVYTYVANGNALIDSKIEITETATPAVVVDTITPLVETPDTSWEFTGLTTGTNYTIKIYQGTTELASQTQTTV